VASGYADYNPNNLSVVLRHAYSSPAVKESLLTVDNPRRNEAVILRLIRREAGLCPKICRSMHICSVNLYFFHFQRLPTQNRAPATTRYCCTHWWLPAYRPEPVRRRRRESSCRRPGRADAEGFSAAREQMSTKNRTLRLLRLGTLRWMSSANASTGTFRMGKRRSWRHRIWHCG
jgi:hypothetical protein